jgi:hypothetical protein
MCVWLYPKHLGLNEFKGLNVSLDQPTPLDVSLRGGLGVLDVSAAARIVATTPFGPTLAVSLQAGLKTVRLDAAAHFWMSVHQVVLQRTHYLADLANATSCPVIQNLLVKGVSLTMEDLILRLALDPQGTTLSSDLIALINNLSSFFLTAFPSKQIAKLASGVVATAGPEVLQKKVQPLIDRAEEIVRTCNTVHGGGGSTSAVGRASSSLERASPPLEGDFRGFRDLFAPDMMVLYISVSVAFVLTILFIGVAHIKTKKEENTRMLLLGLAVGSLLFSVAFLVVAAASNLAWAWVTVRNAPSGSSLSTPVLVKLTYVLMVTESWQAGEYVNAISTVAFGLVVPIIAILALVIVGAYVVAAANPGGKPLQLAVTCGLAAKFPMFMPVLMVITKVLFNMSIVLLGGTELVIHFYWSAGFYLFLGAALLGCLGSALMAMFVSHRVGPVPGSAVSVYPASRTFKIPPLVQFIIYASCVAGFGLVVYALFRPAVRFDMTGVAAQIVHIVSPSGTSVTTREFSVFDFISLIATGAPPGWSKVGLVAVSVILGATALGFVLLLPVLLIIGTAFVPTRHKIYFHIMACCRLLIATDLWGILLLGAAMQFQKQTDRQFATSLAPVAALLEQFPGLFGTTVPLRLSLTALPTVWLLIGGAVLILALSVVIMSLWLYDSSREKPSIGYRAALCLHLIRRLPPNDVKEHSEHWQEMSSENLFARQEGEGMKQPLLSNSQRMSLLTPTVSKRSPRGGKKKNQPVVRVE